MNNLPIYKCMIKTNLKKAIKQEMKNYGKWKSRKGV